MSGELSPESASPQSVARRHDGSRFRTGWARTPPANALREIVQVVGLGPIVRREVDLDVHGLEYVRELEGPALFVANHSSHLEIGRAHV